MVLGSPSEREADSFLLRVSNGDGGCRKKKDLASYRPILSGGASVQQFPLFFLCNKEISRVKTFSFGSSGN